VITNRNLGTNTGALAAAAWLAERELFPKDPKWSVEIDLESVTDLAAESFSDKSATRFQIEVYAAEWGFLFSHHGRLSWIRVTDVPFVHGRDEHELLRQVPPLSKIDSLIKKIERQHAIHFNRMSPTIRTTIIGAEPQIASWVESL
jgi:hypothetical protein